jgi:diguanylate cyclase (GGDEF)-like protein
VMCTSARIRGMFVGIIELCNANIPDISLSLLSILLLNSANALESFELYKMISDINKDLEQKVKERTKQLEYHALHDPLTNLPNRTLIFDRIDYEIKASKRNEKKMALLLIDLDRFKVVNDTLGHFAGDKLLVEFGRRLCLLNRESDTVARLGGDEFGVFLPEISSDRSAVEVAQRILGNLDEPFVIEGRTIDVDASIGIALIPEHGLDKETIFRKADVAMYDAKRTRSGFTIFDSKQDEGTLAHLTLMGELRKALDYHELFLCYQPKVEMASNRLCGVEALLRWNNPKRGFVPPAEFIPIAEQSGLIRPLTLRSLLLAIQQERQWLDSGLEIPVAVNLSAVSLQDMELPGQIAALLNEYHVPARYLELEITESAIMTTPNRGLEVLKCLDGMGITLSIDDFGTGYSSLSYLKKLPVHTIKIDLSFVVNIHVDEKDSKIVRAIVDLGHNLGLQVIAEGVEKQETWEKLLSLGCNMAQGYFIGRPLPADRFSCWLKTAPWRL